MQMPCKGASQSRTANCAGTCCAPCTSANMRMLCRQLLADVLGSHSLQGCPGRPSFGMDSLILGAPPALVMRCSSCSSVQVVV